MTSKPRTALRKEATDRRDHRLLQETRWLCLKLLMTINAVGKLAREVTTRTKMLCLSPVISCSNGFKVGELDGRIETKRRSGITNTARSLGNVIRSMLNGFIGILTGDKAMKAAAGRARERNFWSS